MPSVGEKLQSAFVKNEFPDIETMTAFSINSIKKFTELKNKRLTVKQLNNLATIDVNYKECNNCNLTTYTSEYFCDNCTYIYE